MTCIELDHAPVPKKAIGWPRSFEYPAWDLVSLNEAVTEFAIRVAQKVRRQHSPVGQVMVFIRTSAFRSDPQCSRAMTVPLHRHSNDTAVIVAAALSGLKAIYRARFKLAKAGVMLMDLQSDTQQQAELNLQDEGRRDRGPVMTAQDNIKHGMVEVPCIWPVRGVGERWVWSMKEDRRTPQYTTCIHDLPVVRP